MNTNEFTILDQSTKPVAWMVENVDPQEITRIGVNVFVETAVRGYINAMNTSDQTDAEVYETWLESGEFEMATSWIVNWIEESILNSVLTSGEVAEIYGIADATVRQTIARDAIRARKSGNVWLILRSDAEKFWNRNATKGVTTWLVTVIAVLAIVSQL